MYEVILTGKEPKQWSEKMGRLNHLDAQIDEADWAVFHTEMLESEIDELIRTKENVLAAYNKIIKRQGYYKPVER